MAKVKLTRPWKGNAKGSIIEVAAGQADTLVGSNKATAVAGGAKKKAAKKKANRK